MHRIIRIKAYEMVTLMDVAVDAKKGGNYVF